MRGSTVLSTILLLLIVFLAGCLGGGSLSGERTYEYSRTTDSLTVTANHDNQTFTMSMALGVNVTKNQFRNLSARSFPAFNATITGLCSNMNRLAYNFTGLVDEAGGEKDFFTDRYTVRDEQGNVIERNGSLPREVMTEYTPLHVKLSLFFDQSVSGDRLATCTSQEENTLNVTYDIPVPGEE